MKKSNKSIKIGEGEPCPKCGVPMERRSHPPSWRNKKTYYYKQWDMCVKCRHIQHYEEFKSAIWQEDEQQQSFFNSLR